MKPLALLLLALPLAACATGPTINPQCAYTWVDDSCGKYYLSYQYPRTPGNYEGDHGFINDTAPLGAPSVSHWRMSTSIYNGFNSVGLASAASSPANPYPAYIPH
jgi:hypothetical protein